MKKKKLLSILVSLVMTVSLTTPAFADLVNGDAVIATALTKDEANTVYTSSDGNWSVDLGVFMSDPGKSVNQQSDIYRGGIVSGTITCDDGVTLSKNTWTVSAASDGASYSTEDKVTASGQATISKDYTVTFDANSDETGISRKSDKVTIHVVVPAEPADTTAPVVSATPDRDANENGWYNNDVTVSFSASDVESGIKSVDEPITVTSEGKEQLISGNAINGAGLVGTGSTTISIDKTAPMITGSIDKTKNAAGWYKDDVTVSFAADDALSGIASITSPVTLTEGADQSVTGKAVDKAGNSADSSVSGINIDKTAPAITVENGGTYTLNQIVSWSASDALSGLATSASGMIDTSKVGPRTQTITAADNAGNTSTVTITYNVKYVFSGIQSPINANGSSVFKAGSTIPVKFFLKDASGAYISTASATITYAKLVNGAFGNDAEAVSTSSAVVGNEFRYDLTSNQYIFNMNTKGLTSGTYRLTITLDDGMSYCVQIGLK
jgi:hypothetical protein